MATPQLGIDSEDLGLDILPAIENSFGIKFEESDFHQAFTYGELCALVQRKILQHPAVGDCTSQQAFYKLRKALRPLVGPADIRPATCLAGLLPADPRPAAAHLDASLAVKLNMITMPKWAEAGGSTLLLSAISFLPVALLAALLGGETWGIPILLLVPSCLGLAFLIFGLGARIGKRLVYGTVGELAIAMSARHYRQSRRNPDTVNLREVKTLLDHVFVEMAGLEVEQLVPEAVL